MKKVLLLYGLLVAVLFILYIVKNQKVDFLSSRSSSAQIEGVKFNLEIADSEKERMTGLTKKSALKDKEGMLFIFPKKGKYSFWTKDMKFPIDIIFVNDNTVVEVYKNIPAKDVSGRIPVISPVKDSNYVIELSAGSADKYNISPQDKVEFENL